MMTLDDVIEAMERCSTPHYFDCKGCPYEDDDAEVGCRSDDRDADALQYLKEYRGLLKMWNDKLDKEQENQPLTWEELRTMESKPVWVEERSCRLWIIARNFQRVQYGNIDTEWLRTDIREIYYDKADLGKTWQAYRKER